LSAVDNAVSVKVRPQTLYGIDRRTDSRRDLDNITLYWLTNTGVSASRLDWEYKLGFFGAKGTTKKRLREQHGPDGDRHPPVPR
jgi:hypothetical protein